MRKKKPKCKNKNCCMRSQNLKFHSTYRYNKNWIQHVFSTTHVAEKLSVNFTPITIWAVGYLHRCVTSVTAQDPLQHVYISLQLVRPQDREAYQECMASARVTGVCSASKHCYDTDLL